MIEQIRVHQKVEKDIEQMSALDNAPAIASGRARAIIKALSRGVSVARAGLLSKSKDARIKNLFKYNLGKGYRLITIKEEKQIFVLFIGDHDQCDRWLDANSKKSPHRRPIPMKVYPVTATATEKLKKTLQDQRVTMNQEEMDMMASVSQKELRRIFCGLIN